LEMGFQDAVDAIIDLAPKNRQSLLFSATFPDQIKGIAGKLLKDPVMVKVESTHSGNSIDQQFFNVDNNDARKQAIQLLLMQYQPESCVIFCNTKIETVEVTDFLLDSNFGTFC
jgi:ATP-independent RNA helicase DbpA